ncbi:MAG: DUF3098 domain-containing protein [Bacteroidota bacterium]
MTEKQYLFSKKNYLLMGIGLALIALGYFLMSGGATTNPEIFNEEMFSSMRIRVAPLVVVVGFAVEIWAILAKPNK